MALSASSLFGISTMAAKASLRSCYVAAAAEFLDLFRSDPNRLTPACPSSRKEYGLFLSEEDNIIRKIGGYQLQTTNIPKLRALLVNMLVAFLILVNPVRSFSQNVSQESVLTGNLYRADSKTPVSNATVKIRSTDTNKEYASPTDKGGAYKIAGIEQGWYSVGVSSNLGDYNLKYVLHFNAGSKVRFNLSMKEAGVLDGMQLDPTAPNGFFSTAAGILTIILAVLAFVLGFAYYLRQRMKNR
jgi:hypothetical protein